MINYIQDIELKPTVFIRSNIQQPNQQERKCRSSPCRVSGGEKFT